MSKLSKKTVKKPKQKLGPNQRKWLIDLETTKAKQASGVLNNGNGGYCCLGRACVALGFKAYIGSGWDEGAMFYGKRGDAQEFSLPEEVKDLLAVYNSDGKSRLTFKPDLIELNDEERLTFKEIAAVIREDPSVYFKKPA